MKQILTPVHTGDRYSKKAGVKPTIPSALLWLDLGVALTNLATPGCNSCNLFVLITVQYLMICRPLFLCEVVLSSSASTLAVSSVFGLSVFFPS